MTEKQLHALFETWKHRLGLDLWRTEVRVRPCEEEDSYMEAQLSVYYDAAIFFVQPWVLTGQLPLGMIEFEVTEDRIEEKVVHELLHCCLRDQKQALHEDLDGQLHRDVHSTLKSTYKRAEERAIEALAYALVRAWHE